MKRRALLAAVVWGLALSGCAKNEGSEKQRQTSSEAKVRADAARKEMETLPQTFRPRYNKRLDPVPAPTDTASPKK